VHRQLPRRQKLHCVARHISARWSKYNANSNDPTDRSHGAPTRLPTGRGHSPLRQRKARDAYEEEANERGGVSIKSFGGPAIQSGTAIP
jgi:hypothetical protein